MYSLDLSECQLTQEGVGLVWRRVLASHHLPQLSPHVAREIAEFPLVECDVIHYHMQGRSEQAGH